MMLNSGKWPQIFCHIQRHNSKKSKCRGPALQGYIGYIGYGTLRTGGVEDSDIKDKTLRTGDIERFFPFVRELKIHEKYREIMKEQIKIYEQYEQYEQYEKRYYISIKNEESGKKNTKNWYTINALGATLDVQPL